MGGGGGGSHKTVYEPTRIGVDARKYGELSKTGIQNIDQYNQYSSLVKGGGGTDTGGAKYDFKWNRWKTNTGVDMESALKDWDNYQNERIEIAEYEARDARRKAAPDDLTGTTGNVDFELAIPEEDKDKKETSVGATNTIDTSPSTASTNQALGIY